MKRRIAMLLVLVMSVMVLAGCGGSGAAGTYKMTKAEANGKEIEMDALSAMLGGKSLEMTVTLKDDGNADLEANVMGQEQKTTGTWKEDGDKVVIKTSDGQEQSLEYKDGKLYVDSVNGIKIVLEK